MRRFISVFLTFFLSVCVLQAKAQNPVFDVKNYDAEIEPDLGNKSVKGAVTIKFFSLNDGLREITLNAGALEIDSVKENSVDSKFEKKENLLKIQLARFLKKGETGEVRIVYHSVPKYGMQFFAEQSQIYTIFSTSQWMPCVDAPADKAAFRLKLILPKDLKTVGNGDFIKQRKLSNDKFAFEWEEKKPFSTYLFGFAVGNFREIVQNHRGVKLRFLAAPQFSETEIRQIFRDTADMLDFYESKSGVKYPSKTYTQVLALSNAQQEMSDFSALNEEYGRGVLKDEKDIWLGTHEFAHQWWGNSLTNTDWTHFWLNEGLANFMTAAYLEHRFGRAEYLSEIKRYKESYEKVRDAGKDKSLVFPDWNKPTREDRRLVYDKGAYVVHLLREEVGEDLFWKGFKEYTQKFAGKSVETKDFQTSMEKSSGKDLSKFFDKWIYLTAK